VYAHTPRTLVLAGPLDAAGTKSLLDYCRLLYGSGQTRLHIDMAGVTECHRAALDGLQALSTGATGLAVSLAGAHPGQFTALLRTAPPSDAEDLGDSVRALCCAPADPEIAAGTFPGSER
jgi:STAS domain-containing protein